MSDLEDLEQRETLAPRTARRIYGPMKALVADLADPFQIGRIHANLLVKASGT